MKIPRQKSRSYRSFRSGDMKSTPPEQSLPSRSSRLLRLLCRFSSRGRSLSIRLLALAIDRRLTLHLDRRLTLRLRPSLSIPRTSICIATIQKVLPVAYRSRCFRLGCLLLGFKIRSRCCDGCGRCAAEGDLLFLVVFVHFFLGHVHGAADGAASFAEDEP